VTDLSVELGGLRLKNPVIAASGTFGYGRDYVNVGNISSFGAVTVKGTTLRPRIGNPPPRIWETASGMLNSIGLENPGAEVVINEMLPWLSRFEVPILVNISADTVGEFSQLAAMFSGAKEVAALEVNVSCPNVHAGGMAFGVEPRTCYRVVMAIRNKWNGCLIVKLSPNVFDICSVARAAVEGGADVLSVINTITGMAIDINTGKPALGNVIGGLSGPCIKPVALRCVYQVSQAVNVPVIGMGGVFSSTDAIEFMMAGATAVGLGTSLLVYPDTPVKIVQGLREYCEKEGLQSIMELVGKAWK
jgi:dihydroorotate dehydrogenase (NAD+) catalytic subunit